MKKSCRCKRRIKYQVITNQEKTMGNGGCIASLAPFFLIYTQTMSVMNQEKPKLLPSRLRNVSTVHDKILLDASRLSSMHFFAT